ncbi:tyrosine phosphatase-like protein [Blastocladiella britannica]|nr:tyrosine phosphatase-like protein [Blastocladiella britannica]
MSSAQRIYLVVYNLVSFIGWSAILVRAAAALATGTPLGGLYAVVGDDLRRVQTLALFEIVHAVLGVVKSPFFTTATQVASRLMIVWVNLYYVTDASVQTSPAFASLILAWGVTELIRYSLYGLAQVDVKPYWLTWLRYSSFLPLYPIGVASECTLIYMSTAAAEAVSPLLKYLFLTIIVVVYPPGLFMLYSFMLRQRRKVLGGGGSGAAKKVKSQ